MVFHCLVIKNPSLLKPQRQFNTAGHNPLGHGHTHKSSQTSRWGHHCALWCPQACNKELPGHCHLHREIPGPKNGYCHAKGVTSPDTCSVGNADWPPSRGRKAGSAVTAAHTPTHTYSTIQTHTGSPAKEETLFSGFHKEMPLIGIFQDSVAILWHGVSITNSMFLRVKKGKMKTDQQYNLLQCISTFFLEKVCEHYQFNISAMIFWYCAISWEKDIIRKIQE